jgi:hypothetical protein
MRLKDGEVISEPYIPAIVDEKIITLSSSDDLTDFKADDIVLVDYYHERNSGVS